MTQIVPADMSVDQIAQTIRSWGSWAVACSILLTVAHSFVPLPSEFIAIANGIVFCISCHMEGAQSIPPLASFESVQKVAKADTGTSITDLAKVSHIHLFGISIIFLLTGAIFALSETPVSLRGSLVVVPYLTILMDIGSWWFTKYLDPAFFAYVVIAGGACMGLALAAQILIALWEMWIEPLKTALGGSRSRAITPLTFRP